MAAAAHARSNPIRKAGGDQPPASGGGSVTQQRLQGAFLTIIGLAGAFGGVLFSIEAPKYTPVPVVFLSFWLVMVIVGQVLFAGLRKLRAAGVGAPAPEQVRAAAAVAGIVVAVGMMGFAATTAGGGSAVAAPCPGGGPATCGPTPGQPELTFTPPAGQQTAPGGQQGQQGAQQDNNGIATSPTSGGSNDGGNILAQTPDFGTPGQPTPNIPGNPTEQAPQPGQGQGQGQQQSPQTTQAGGPQQQQPQTGQQTQTGQASPSQPTVTVTKTQSECPAPGAAGGNGGPGTPGAGGDSSGGAGSGPDGGEQKEGAPSWAYLVGETSALLTGRRRNVGGGGTPTLPGDESAADTTELARRSDTAADSEGDDDTTSDSQRQLGTWTDPVDGQQYITETTAGSDEVTVYRPDGQPVGRAPQTLLTKEQADYAKKGMTLAQVLAGQYKNQGRMITPLRATSKELQSLADATRRFSSADPAEAAALQAIRQAGGQTLPDAIKKADVKSGLKPLPIPGSGTAASTLQAAETAAQTTRSAGQVLSQSADPALNVIGSRATSASSTVSNTSKAVQAAESVGKVVRRAGWVMAPAGVALDIASGMSPGKAVTAGVASTAGGIAGAAAASAGVSALASSGLAVAGLATAPILPAIAVGAAGAAVGYGAYKGAQYVWDHAVSDGVKQTVDNGLKSAGSAVASGAKSVGSAVSSGAKKIAGWFS